MSSNYNNLTEGPIFSKLVKMAIPIMATSFVQMAYNMTDMMWLGNLSSKAVASVGSAAFLVWFGNSLGFLTKVGSEVSVSQAIGRKDFTDARNKASTSLLIAILIALSYTIIIQLFAPTLLSPFEFEDKSVLTNGVLYLRTVSLGFMFMYLNPTFTGIYNGAGVTKTPFYFNTIGLVVNIILDPMLIYGFGPFPAMEVKGAAIATVISQALVGLLFVGSYIRGKFPIPDLKFKLINKFNDIKYVVKLGFPIALHSALFAMISFTISQLASKWGATAVAVMSVGAQIESVSWMTASGLSTAIGSFTGQNMGAGNLERIRKGYIYTFSMTLFVGLLATISFLFFGEEIFGQFIPEKEAVEYGVIYLKIIAYSQIFMCVEIATAGTFNGLGKTIPPSVIGIVFTGARIPLAYLLTSAYSFGIVGIWWTVSSTTIIKGIIATVWVNYLLFRISCKDCKRTKFFSWMIPYRFRYRRY
ncbi:MAG: MATE family efflux transporter [Candidatus Cloacimonadota bacterium]|nr:MAG: MATE family efflux transporter [Candidatus Cloacimonadota bacterium]PIE78531.1 MAG: MATE family efflux transporter [Candidatus Delongbacteria bacterium]